MFSHFSLTNITCKLNWELWKVIPTFPPSPWVYERWTTVRNVHHRRQTLIYGDRQVILRINLICNFIILLIYSSPGSSISILESAVTTFPHVQRQQTATVSRCNEVSGVWAPCICSLELCIGWYPCGLKYCKGKSENNNSLNNNQINTSYRCGIKTCRKCNSFNYYVRQKQLCLWDDWPRKSKKHHSSTLRKYFRSIFNFNLL